MLKWLDSDFEKAAEKYGHIHSVLVKIFYSSGFQNAEELADETIDRVAAQINTLEKNFEGEKIKYFWGVANFIKKETFRQKANQSQVNNFENIAGNYDRLSDEEDLSEDKSEYLKKCLKKLNSKDRKMVLGYYNVTDSDINENDLKKKIAVHKNLAKKYSITVNALRVQVFRIKSKLTECIEKYAEKRRLM